MQRRNVWLATALLNSRVRNSAGEDLGKIEDIVIDAESGAIRYAILSIGGLGDDKLFAIPWSSLSLSPSRDFFLQYRQTQAGACARIHARPLA